MGVRPLSTDCGELAVVKTDVAQARPLKILAGAEAVALQDVLDPAVEPLHPAVRFGPHRRSEAVLDAKLRAEAVELVVPGGRTAAEAEEPVGALCRCP